MGKCEVGISVGSEVHSGLKDGRLWRGVHAFCEISNGKQLACEVGFVSAAGAAGAPTIQESLGIVVTATGFDFCCVILTGNLERLR